jgi:hypothetical protein
MNYTNPDEFWRHNDYDPYKGLSDDERMQVGCFQGLAFFLVLFIGLAVCALLSGCTTERLVTVEKVRTDTAYITKHQRDSIYIEQHDSIVLHTKGDTVTVERWHWRDRWRDRVKTDTIYMSKTDTVVVTKEPETAKSTTLWHDIWQHKWRLAIILIIMAIALWIWKTK